MHSVTIFIRMSQAHNLSLNHYTTRQFALRPEALLTVVGEAWMGIQIVF
jgi:hypothetical protein